MRGSLRPEVMLDIRLSACCSRNQFTTDPGPVVDELRRLAGARMDVLAAAVGQWVGYYDNPDRHMLAVRLLDAFPDAARWVPVGAAQRARPIHGTGEYRSP